MRALSSNKVWKQLTGIFRGDDSATTTTTNGTAVKGATSIDFTSAASFAIGDKIRIGANGEDAEVNVIQNIVTNTVTVVAPFSRAIASGETVTKLTAVDLGAMDESGFTPTWEQSEEDIIAGDRVQVYARIPGALNKRLRFNLRDFEKENLASMIGADESDTAIVGTNAVVLADADYLSLGFKPWWAEGVLIDGTAVTAIVMSAKVSSTNAEMQLSTQGERGVSPFDMESNGSIAFHFA